jgi:hypothetical protein
MTVQTLTKVVSTSSIFDFILTVNLKSAQPDPLTAADFGFEVGDEELAEELSETIPSSLIPQTAPQVDPEDFETIYNWFIS